MKAFGYAAASKSAPLAPWSFDRREPNPDDVVLAIDYCGICTTMSDKPLSSPRNRRVA